jgi:hypothetical protein
MMNMTDVDLRRFHSELLADGNTLAKISFKIFNLLLKYPRFCSVNFIHSSQARDSPKGVSGSFRIDDLEAIWARVAPIIPRVSFKSTSGFRLEGLRQ